ncbi:MAG: hypothetical protein Q9227_005992 [Pyrenula ochraceoflavens]
MQTLESEKVYDCLDKEIRGKLSRNVLLVLQRQHRPPVGISVPVFPRIFEFYQELVTFQDNLSAFVIIARLYDAAYIAHCRYRKGREKETPLNHTAAVGQGVDITSLLQGIHTDQDIVSARIVVSEDGDKLLAKWEPIRPAEFSSLPHIQSLSEISKDLGQPIVIAGGGGSDIISASLVQHLLSRSQESQRTPDQSTSTEAIEAHQKAGHLISTRTRLTGSQGKPGSKIGEERKVFSSGGQATLHGHPVPDTYKILPETEISGRALETVPLSRHNSVYLILDQTGHENSLPPEQRTDLTTQYQAVISTITDTSSTNPSIISIDTGGDVLHPSPTSQDHRVQLALASLPTSIDPSSSPLLTLILSPGVDSPPNALSTASSANAHFYPLHTNPSEKTLLLDLLKEYRMDGSDPTRFGKTSLCFQKALRGELGWQVLELPEHVVMTGENPWAVFEWIEEGMAGVVVVETRKLVEVMGNMVKGGEGG